ncbi:MAG: EamA family transporter, partial [Gordonibacter urolithinfaciens]
MEGGRDAGAKPRIGQEGRRALVQAAFCYAIWGVVPVYWKLFSAVPPLQALATRMVWSCAFSVVLCLAMRVRFLPLLHDRRAWATFGASSVLIAANWGVYIWASTSGHLLETSLGFFLSPLTSIVLGVVCFRERLTRAQKAATMLATCGALLFAATHGGSVWIALVLAATFSAYGAVKKRGGYDALPGMAVESLFAAVL